MSKSPSRPSMSKSRRARIFMAHGGVCEICSEKIVGPYEIEHRISWALTNDDSDENLYPAHVECHSEKTKADIRSINKSKRQALERGQQARRAAGKTKPIPSKPFPKGQTSWPKRSFPKRGE